MRRAAQHESRLASREEQTRSWAAPLPDFAALPPRGVGDEPRVRLEWESRDTINGRLWSDMVASGAHQVTAAMLAAHPTGGAAAVMPSSGRHDGRPYGTGATTVWMSRGAGAAAPTTMPGVQSRPVPPPASLFGTAWMNGADVEGGDAARELRGVVKEENSRRAEDSAGRFLSRAFDNQWMTTDVREGIVRAQLTAAERLRPEADDWRRQFGGGGGDTC